MITIEKLLSLITASSVPDANDYFRKEGFFLDQNEDDYLRWVKPLKTDRSEIISLFQMEGAYKSVNYLFSEEKRLSDLQKDATANFGFVLIEDEEEIIMRTAEFQLSLKKDDYPPFTSYSLKLHRRNKQREADLIEVSMSPPPGV